MRNQISSTGNKFSQLNAWPSPPHEVEKSLPPNVELADHPKIGTPRDPQGGPEGALIADLPPSTSQSAALLKLASEVVKTEWNELGGYCDGGGNGGRRR